MDKNSNDAIPTGQPYDVEVESGDVLYLTFDSAIRLALCDKHGYTLFLFADSSSGEIARISDVSN